MLIVKRVEGKTSKNNLILHVVSQNPTVSEGSKVLLCPQHSHSPVVTSSVLFLSATSLQPPVILKRAGQSAATFAAPAAPSASPNTHTLSGAPQRGLSTNQTEDADQSLVGVLPRCVLSLVPFSFSPYFSLHTGLRNR